MASKRVQLTITAQRFFDDAQNKREAVRVWSLPWKLPYWIEKWPSQPYIKAWIKVPSIPAGGSTTVKIYYGNSSAVSESDGEAVFDFFDDFEGSSLDTSKWEIRGTAISVTVSNSILTVTGGSTSWEYVACLQAFSYGRILEMNVKVDSDEGNYFIGLDDRAMTGSLQGAELDQAMIPNPGTYGLAYLNRREGNRTTATRSLRIDTWRVFTIKWLSDKVIYQLDYGADEQIITSNVPLDSMSFTVWVGESGKTVYVDWVRVRKYAEQEPTITIGEEQPSDLEGWAYMREITINNPNSVELTDFQTLVTLSGYNVVENDGRDLRFYTSDGQTEIPYYLEEVSKGDNAKVWVKVPKIPGNGSVDLYIYYGNPQAQSESNGEAVFELFDDFDIPWGQPAQVAIDTTSYDAFGVLVRASESKVLYITRKGTGHLNGGSIVLAEYDIQNDTWSAFRTIYDSSWDDRGVGGGMVGNKLVIFLTHYDPPNSAIVDVGFITSDDGGQTWSDFTSVASLIPISVAHTSPYGNIVKVGETYYQPIYGWDSNTGTYYVWLLKSTDGVNWELGPTVYSGTSPKITETWVVHIGDGKLIALGRKEDGGYLQQFTSSDGGQTWSGPFDTNLGTSTGVKMAALAYDDRTNKVIAIFCDRGDSTLKLSVSDADTIFSNPTAWEPAENLMTMGLGYPAVVEIGYGTYLWVAAHEVSSTDADTYYGIETTRWDVIGAPTLSFSGSVLTISGYSLKSPPDNILSTLTFGTDVVLEAYVNVDYTGANAFGVQLADSPEGYKYDSASGTSPTNVAGTIDRSNKDDLIGFVTTDGTSRNYVDGGSWTGGWDVFTIQRATSSVYIKVGSYEWTSTQSLPSGDLHVLVGGYASDPTIGKQPYTAQVDWVRVRKYAEQEPTVVVGEEEASDISGWLYRRKITITNPNPYDLEHFQVAIDLDGSNFDFTKANADGSDIRVAYASARYSLPYYIETWDTATPQAVIWVGIDSETRFFVELNPNNTTDESDESVMNLDEATNYSLSKFEKYA